MKYFKLYISFLILCSYPTFGQHEVLEIDILKEYKLKDVSIRAIEVINDSTLWFAGTKGRFGRIINDQIEIDSISHQSTFPNFRSIGFNGKHIFLLSIENPALLYKLDPYSANSSIRLVYKEVHPDVFYDSLTFFNEEIGIAIGDPVDGCISVLKSSDSGDKWKKISCDKLPAIYEGEAAFAASNTNITTFGKKSWIATGGKKARVFLSEDYGEHWAAVNTPMIQGDKMTGIFSIDFFNDKIGIIMGGNWEDKANPKGSRAMSKDGGYSWFPIGEEDIPGYISCVQFINKKSSNEIIAVSTEGIFFTNNRAKNWSKISDQGFYSVRMINTGSGWLSGNEKIVKLKLRSIKK